MAAVEIPPGGREGRHTHPGVVVVYIQEGVLTFDYEGSPTTTYKAGDSLMIRIPGAGCPGLRSCVSSFLDRRFRARRPMVQALWGC